MDDKPDLVTTANALNSGAIHLLRALRLVDRTSRVSPARLSALSVLVFVGPLTIGRLATAEDVAGPTMTRIVDGLVALGLAERASHPDSARLVLVGATEKGRQVMHVARARRIEALAEALRTLPSSQRRQWASAAPTLEQLAKNVRASIDQAVPESDGTSPTPGHSNHHRRIDNR